MFASKDQAQRHGVIDIRLLPPFSELGGNIKDRRAILTADFENIGGQALEHLGFFINAVNIEVNRADRTTRDEVQINKNPF
jgi:hypothetical protein